MRPTSQQKTALRAIHNGTHWYDPDSAQLVSPASTPPVPRHVLDVLVARAWATWGGPYGLTLTDAGREALTSKARNSRGGARRPR